MLKRYIAFFLFCIANLLIIGHDIIPHKHSADSSDIELGLNTVSDHHGHHHHGNSTNDHHNSEKNEEESSDLGELFANFAHIGYYCFQTENRTNSIVIEKRTLSDAFSLFTLGHNIEYSCLLSTQQNCRWYDKPIFLSPHSLSSGLRAPPVFFS
jgi:hypothetical protein